ncbi:hypothetical protein KSS87_006822 [Heliosperma pusillum]|nr:hypothetical protein KSS87_014344 [Heliosperma pusillum]KAH9626144.1 hypothetical protein KSS87_006822 [Heliosperma pusillum]
MEDTFKVRVDKTFGSLSSSSPLPPPSLSSSSSSSQTINPSLWSLTDDELRPNHWTRESDDPPSDDDNDDVDKDELDKTTNDLSSPTTIDKFFVSSPGNPNPNLDIGDNQKMVTEGDEAASSSRGIEGNVELDVRNSIGLDSTLDFEEEEDEFDKVAVGKEKPDDRLYMCDVSDYVSHIESENEVPSTFQEASRDPRANHFAAKLRLKEDAKTARDFNSLHVSEQSLPVVSSAQSNPHDGEVSLKSILKRKEDQTDSKSEKRVRFDPGCKNNYGDEYEVDEHLTSEPFNKEITVNEGASSQLKQTSLIPDYIRNPSKYTHYTFDTSSDMNEASNRQAYADFLSMLRKSKQSEPEEVPADLSKPVLFNPKNKPRNVKSVGNVTDNTTEESVDRKRPAITCAVGSEIDDEACEMEVDEQATSNLKSGNVKKTGRRYRSKPSLEYDESEA